MKVYILTDQDFDKLLAEIDRNPEYGQAGGSSRALSKNERRAFEQAHRFYNFLIRKWIDGMKRPIK